KEVAVGEMPLPVVIGSPGRLPPTEVIMSVTGDFDPATNGADFYETLEGMLVAVKLPIVVGPISAERFEFYVVADRGAGATGMNAVGGITVTPGDFNPERIQVQVTKQQAPSFQVRVGDTY